MKNKKRENMHGISVIIPTFNRASYLYSTLICLCNQKIEPGTEFEIIIIDSGDDETEKIVQFFLNSYDVPIIYKKIKKCRNRSLVRNKGAELADYDIFCFLDNDMLVPPDFIQRHLYEHRKKKNLVLMGCRRFLTEFNIEELGEETLIRNYYLLEKLPWYADERLEIYEDYEQWRFVFSHTLSMEREDFFRAGKFNVKFGEHWGLEDLELGFNLMQKNCSFKLITDSFTYHQPHFSQSNKEQHEDSYNGNLFLMLHNCFEIELYECFYKNFSDYCRQIQKIKTDFNCSILEKENTFDLILGCLYSTRDNLIYEKSQLGCIIPKSDKEIEKTLVLSTFFDMPLLIQCSILKEAFRVSKKVYFCLNGFSEDKLNVVSNYLGIQCNIHPMNNYIHIKLLNYKVPRFAIFLLPDIFCPEKRFVCKWLSAKFIENDYILDLQDLKNTLDFPNEDYSLSKRNENMIEKSQKKYFGNLPFQTFSTFSNILYNGISIIKDSSLNVLFHDDDFDFLIPSKIKYLYKESLHFDTFFYSLLCFISVWDSIKTNKILKTDCKKNIDKMTFCCFMENGFIEDGIDIILSAFFEFSKKNNCFLKIKVPDFNKLKESAFPSHNQESKKTKLFEREKRLYSDYNNLQKIILEKKLNKCVEIIKENKSIVELLDFVNNCDSIIHASRSFCVPPQVYIAILLNKTTFIATNHVMIPMLKEFCITVNSEYCNYSQEFNEPLNCNNLNLQICKIMEDDLVRKLGMNKNLEISQKTIRKLEEDFYKIMRRHLRWR